MTEPATIKYTPEKFIFSSPENFHFYNDGEPQFTIRRGVKNGYEEGQDVLLACTDGRKEPIRAKIAYVQVIAWNMIDDDKRWHMYEKALADCNNNSYRTLAYMYRKLSDIYKSFDECEIVTLIWFEVVSDD